MKRRIQIHKIRWEFTKLILYSNIKDQSLFFFVSKYFFNKINEIYIIDFFIITYIFLEEEEKKEENIGELISFSDTILYTYIFQRSPNESLFFFCFICDLISNNKQKKKRVKKTKNCHIE